jgi:hypothetical protein
MNRALLIIDALSAFVGKAFAWMILAMTFAISYEVFCRYALGTSYTATGRPAGRRKSIWRCMPCSSFRESWLLSIRAGSTSSCPTC